MDRNHSATNSSGRAASTAAPAVPAKRRRWYQFSLRTLIVMTVAVSVLLGLFAARLQRARKQAAAVARIQKVGGSVCYDFEVKRDTDGGWLWVDGSRSPIPGVFLRWLGRDFFHDVLVADLREEDVPSAADMRGAVRAAAELPQLEQFVLAYNSSYDGALGGTELDAIANCRRLKRLTLLGNAVSDDGLVIIAHMSGVSCLELPYSPITDQGLGRLRALSDLEQLDLRGTQVTGAGVHWPPSLKKIDLSDSAISDASLAGLAHCRQLERLALADTRVTDAGLAHLSSLSKLRQLRLDGTPITDDGLMHLSKLRSLRDVSLSRIKLSSDGAKHLQVLQALESLDLSFTFVDGEFDWPAGLLRVDLDNSCLTDKGLLQLPRCRKLRSASFGHTLATSDGVKAFAKERPDVDTSNY
ncbi:MAG TPA: hypothetical protein VMP01_17270 [Pirellulaceae bacterium]|nr:hypothetical protein [Pirellulaceae bacterium]